MKGEGGGAKLTHLHYQNFQYKKDKMSVSRHIKRKVAPSMVRPRDIEGKGVCIAKRRLKGPSVGAYDDRAQGRYDG